MTIRNRFAIVFLLACATLRLSAADAQTPPRPALDAEAIAAVESGLIATDAPPAFVESPPAVEAPADAETGETGGGLTLFGKKLLPKFGKTDEEKARDEAERREKERRIAQEQQAHEKQRDLLAQQEARLAERRQRKVVYRLQDVLNTIDRDAEALAAQAAQRRQELDQLRLRRTALDQTLMQQRSLAYPDPRELLSAEQTLINHNERMVLLNLQIDYWDTLNVLAAEANRIDGIVKALPATPRPTLRRIIDKKRLAAEEERQLFELLVTINEIEIQQTELLAALEILEARFVTLDDEIRLLDEKVALTRSRNDRRALELAELRRDLLGQRIGILREQAASLRNTIETSEAIESLYRIYLEVLHDDFAKLLERYKRSIMVPLSIIAALILVYIAISRLVMPYVYKRDRLFIARRLGCYIMVLIVLIVLIAFFFEDLRQIAPALGIAGAAVVIALQDLCSSFAGWFVIVASRKVRVGDRIQVGEHRGDVIDIQLLRITMLELNNWLDMDEPTGRVIVIPNSFIFKDKVINYSHIHPYVWNKIDITMTFETSHAEAEELLWTILEEESKDEMRAAERAAISMEDTYGVPDTLYVPKLSSIIADSGVLYRMVFVSHYRRVVGTRNRINNRIIKEVDARPHVNFAYPTERHIPTAEAGGFEVKTLKP